MANESDKTINSNVETVKLLSREQQQQLEISNALYAKLSENIEKLGFEKAIAKAKEYTNAIKEITDSQGNLDSSFRALNSELETIADAMSSANKILSDYPIKIKEAQEKYAELTAEAEEHAKKVQNAIDEENIALKKRNEIVEKNNIFEKDRAEEIEKRSKRILELDAEIDAKRAEQGKNFSDRMVKEQQQEKEILEIQIQQEQQKNNIHQEAAKLADASYEVKKAEVDILVKNQEIIDAKKEQARLQAEQTKNLAEQAAAYMPLLRYEELRVKSLANMDSNMQGFLDKVLASSQGSGALSDIFFGLQESVIGAGGGVGKFFETTLQGFWKNFTDPQQAFNRLANFINDRLIKSTLEFDKTVSSVGKSTGGFRKEFEQIALSTGGLELSFRGLSEYGVTLEKYGEAYGGLSRNVGGFNNMLASQRKVLTDSASTFISLGMSMDTYGQLTAKFIGAFGKTVEGTRDAINQLAKDATALNKSVAEYTTGFQEAMSRVSGYGTSAIQIYKELNTIATATNNVVTAQDLLSISDKFKDFDSAADAVSKLNAMLGGTSVNIIDMMKANPSEQIMMIKRAAAEAGLQFDNLNIGYKRLLAEYFSGDINKAQAFFNADMATAQREFIANEKELAERKKANIDFQTKLDTLMSNMKVMLTPLIPILNGIVKGLTVITEYAGVALAIMLSGLIALVYGLWVGWNYVTTKMKEVAATAVGMGATIKTSLGTIAAEMTVLNGQLTALNAQLATATAEAIALKAALTGVPAAGAAAAGAAGAGTAAAGAAGVVGAETAAAGAADSAGVVGAETAAAGAAGSAGAGKLATAGKLVGGLSVGLMATAVGFAAGGAAGDALDKKLGTGAYRKKYPGEIAIEDGEDEILKTHPDDKMTQIGNRRIYTKGTPLMPSLEKFERSREEHIRSFTTSQREAETFRETQLQKVFQTANVPVADLVSILSSSANTQSPVKQETQESKIYHLPESLIAQLGTHFEEETYRKTLSRGT